MPTCKECKFYQPEEADNTKGKCFGHDVQGEMDSSQCPTGSFQNAGDETDAPTTKPPVKPAPETPAEPPVTPEPPTEAPPAPPTDAPPTPGDKPEGEKPSIKL